MCIGPETKKKSINFNAATLYLTMQQNSFCFRIFNKNLTLIKLKGKINKIVYYTTVKCCHYFNNFQVINQLESSTYNKGEVNVQVKRFRNLQLPVDLQILWKFHILPKLKVKNDFRYLAYIEPCEFSCRPLNASFNFSFICSVKLNGKILII